MSTQRIEIKIASRHYPMTINADEQEMLLACADEINTILKQFEQKYAVSDKQVTCYGDNSVSFTRSKTEKTGERQRRNDNRAHF